MNGVERHGKKGKGKNSRDGRRERKEPLFIYLSIYLSNHQIMHIIHIYRYIQRRERKRERERERERERILNSPADF